MGARGFSTISPVRRPTSLVVVAPAQIAEFLVGERFERSGIDSAQTALSSEPDAKFRHDRLAGSGRSGNQYRATGASLVGGFDLKWVERKRLVRAANSSTSAYSFRSKDSLAVPSRCERDGPQFSWIYATGRCRSLILGRQSPPLYLGRYIV